jgi:hypothetical protein
MEPQPWPFPASERHSAQMTGVLVDPPTSPSRHPRNLARIDESLWRSAGTEVGRKTLDDAIRDKVGNLVDELRLSERLLESLALGAYACIVLSRLLRAPGHARTLPDR